MKAIVLNKYGDSSHLKLAEIPEPQPGAGEIKVNSAGKFRLPIAKRLPLAEAASAQRLAEAGGISKVLLKV